MLTIFHFADDTCRQNMNLLDLEVSAVCCFFVDYMLKGIQRPIRSQIRGKSFEKSPL